MKKKLIIGVVVFSVLLVIVLLNVKFKGKAVSVKVEKVKRGSIKTIVSAPGRISAKNEINISSDIMGKLIKLNVDDGDKVRSGEIVAELEKTREEAVVESARSSLSSAKASYEMKKSSFERRQKLYDKSLISKEQFEADRTDLRVAELTLEERKANYKQAMENLSKTIIRSPINAVVTRLNVEEGEIVVTGTMNNPGTVLMVLSDLSQMEVECDVDESDIIELELGQATDITVDAFGDTVFQGHVVEISNSGKTSGTGSQEEITNFEVKVGFDNTDVRLRPGMSASADIISSEEDSALKVPIQSVVERGMGEKKREGVFIILEEKTHFKPVTTGIQSEIEMQIIEGVEEGDEVVSGPYSILTKIKDGENVKIIQPKIEKGKVEKEGEERSKNEGGNAGTKKKTVRIGG